MTSPSEATRRRLLGSVVSFESESREARQRCDVCYGGFAAAESAEPTTIVTSLELESGHHCAQVSGRPSHTEADFVTAMRSLNHELLHAVMRANATYFYLHAGVVALGDRAVVLPGLSGAGKSTLVLALLQRGARFLSDELLVYDPALRLALPFPRAPKIRDVCLSWFPAFAGQFVGEGEGRFLPLDALGNVLGSPVEVGVVMLPRWNPNGGAFSDPIRGGRLVLALTSSVLNFGTHRARSIDHLAQLARDGVGYAVDWNDPHATADRIVELVT